MTILKQARIVIPGGGSGPLTIEDKLLDEIPNIYAITGVTDNGGHTKKIRIEWGNIAATGDASQRIAVRIRGNPNVRAIFTHRQNGERVGNTFLATCQYIAGSHADGIKLVEESIISHYVGRVIPVSNDDGIHLKFFLKTGKSIVGEDQLDEYMKTKDNTSITHIELTPTPNPNPEALYRIKFNDLVIIPPGSWFGSILAVIEVSGVYKAINESKGKIMAFTNTVDVTGRSASHYLKYLARKIGRKFDLAVINTPNHQLPDSYKQEYLYFVKPDIAECKKYAKEVIALPVSKIYEIDKKPTIRHDGALATEIIKDLLL